MPDPATLFVGIASHIKAAADLAMGLSKLDKLADVQAKAVELQTLILGLQSEAFTAHAQQSAMIEKVRSLEAELARVKAWEETKQGYELHEPTPGAFVYASKAQSGRTEPPHWICTNCYENSRRSILQLIQQGNVHDRFECHLTAREPARRLDVTLAELDEANTFALVPFADPDP